MGVLVIRRYFRRMWSRTKCEKNGIENEKEGEKIISKISLLAGLFRRLIKLLRGESTLPTQYMHLLSIYGDSLSCRLFDFEDNQHISGIKLAFVQLGLSFFCSSHFSSFLPLSYKIQLTSIFLKNYKSWRDFHAAINIHVYIMKPNIAKKFSSFRPQFSRSRVAFHFFFFLSFIDDIVIPFVLNWVFGKPN